ncbi:OmpA family protein [Leptospira idonii]|uniref:OmpA family protein n=1 Tax=Leptospira idonii TaxID=1193500 RepID=UPI001FE5103F|nr:OmpA family protein [Leptospira idonii]
MKQNYSLLLSALLSFPLLAAPQESVLLQWKWNGNQVLELNEYHDVLFRVGARSVVREDKNRVVLKTTKCDSQLCNVDAFFDTYIRFGKTEGPFRKDKEFQSNFIIYRNGKYEVSDEYVMPNLRSFPSFPETNVNSGDSWKIPAEESFDFPGDRIKVAVEPEYFYHGKSNWTYANYKGFSDKITYTYPIYYDSISKRKGAANVPNKIFGFARGTVFFNAEKGIPEYKEVKLSYTFILPDGTVQEANFHIHGVYSSRKSLNASEKEQFKENILQDLIVGYDPITGGKLSDEGEKDPAISVRSTEDGVTFSLDSILFDFNDSKLKPEAEETVKRIASILKKYPEREIRVSGHTDNIGKKDYNLKLSEDRAKSVLHSLVEQNGLDEKRISFRGYGDEKPVAPNDSEANRAKNRRVEITIVLD